MSIEAFFSCSYCECDKDINNVFTNICKGFDINVSNVSYASPNIPPDQALEMINSADIFIAVIVKRFNSDIGWQMPESVNNEISIAFALKKNMLLFCEKGVVMNGFLRNYATYHEFNRETIHLPDIYSFIVQSFYELQKKFFCEHLKDYSSDAFRGCHLYSVAIQTKLFESSRELVWHQNICKKYIFDEGFKEGLGSAIWVNLKPSDDRDIEYDFDHKTLKGRTSYRKEVVKHSAECIEVSVIPKYSTRKDDSIKIELSATSRLLNAIYKSDVDEKSEYITINDRRYYCMDDFTIVDRTKYLYAIIEFPIHYGIDLSDVVPYIGQYTTKIDRVVEFQKNKDGQIHRYEFGECLYFIMEVEKPKISFSYGFAWNSSKVQQTNN